MVMLRRVLPGLKLRLLAGVLGVAGLGALVVLLIPASQPPVSSLEEAKLGLAQARKTGAPKYAEVRYRLAEEQMREGWMEMAHQSGRLAPFRSYRVADSLLSLAVRTALQAGREAESKAPYLDSLARAECTHLRNELFVWRDALNGSLVLFKANDYLSSADLAIRTGQLLIDRGQYTEACQVVAGGKASLNRLSNMLAEYTDAEAQKIAVWRSWVQETLEQSLKRGEYAVIVDKTTHKTHLVRAGNLLRSYDCDLGYNSSHNKLFAGDGATPEGKYEITKVKSRGSKYYKALLLNYPNQTDRKRFEENKKKGIISSHASIGGLIEIHGEGGKNRDWTEGCVALENGEMDDIMKYVTVGTKVTIVRRSDQWP